MPATFIPPLPIIESIATQDELSFINALKDLDEGFEVYYQPVTNIAHIDIAILRRGAGMVLVEISPVDISNCEVVDENGREYYKQGETGSKKLSPFEMVMDYKNEFYDSLSRPLFGHMYVHKQTKYFGLIRTAVYMPHSSFDALKKAYEITERVNEYRMYGKAKDKYIRAFVGCDADWIRSKIENALSLDKNADGLFSDPIYKSLHALLSGLKPSIVLTLPKEFKKYDNETAEQKLHSETAIVEKIKGCAGSGKTQYAVQRAIIRYRNSKKPVLILCYNLTLVNNITDLICSLTMDLSNYERTSNFLVKNYDSFMPQMMKLNGFDPIYISEFEADDDDNKRYNEEQNKLNWKTLHEAQIQVFEDNKSVQDYVKFSSIIIDEYQDYDPSWLKAIEDYFWDKDGELVVLADEKQRIYNNAVLEEKQLKTPGIPKKWIHLKEPFRSTNELIEMFLLYQKRFPQGLDPDEVSYVQKDFLHEKSVLQYCEIDKSNPELIYQRIKKFIEELGIDVENVCVLSSTSEILQLIEHMIRTRDNTIKTIKSFEPLEVRNILRKNYREDSVKYHKLKQKASRIEKTHFHVLGRALKVSTVHSFKGLETKAVIYLLNSVEENPSVVYTAITRAKDHLLVINMGNKVYGEFFKNPHTGFVVDKHRNNDLPF